jgi:hypothetical protein
MEECNPNLQVPSLVCIQKNRSTISHRRQRQSNTTRLNLSKIGALQKVPAACYFRSIVAQMKLTAVYMKVPEGYAAFVEELPGANNTRRHSGKSPREPSGSRRHGFGRQP